MSANSSSSSSTFSRVSWGAFCDHGVPCDVLTSRTAANPGRLFFRCRMRKSDDCNYFEWVDSKTPLFYCRNQCNQIRQMERDHYERLLKAKDEQASSLAEKMQLKEEECEHLKSKLDKALAELTIFKKWVFLPLLASMFFMLAKIMLHD